MLQDAKNIFIVGIGGIGISALARLLKLSGFEVSGSDLEASPITRDLEKEGIKVTMSHRKENLPAESNLLIYSNAVPEDNPERAEAKQRGIKQISYPEALSKFIAGRKVIAVAGTNGKTTTTAMIGQILETGGDDPLVLVGSKVLAWNSNARFGRGKYAVIEADEYRRAFLNYSPDIVVITNIQADHLDYYRDLADIKNAFAEFISRIKPGGTLVYNYDDSVTFELAHHAKGRKISFGLRPGLPNVNPENTSLKLQVPGTFNLINAMAAAAASKSAGVSDDKIVSALAAFTGTWRRFERVGKYDGIEIVSDYAHHPAGISAVLDTAATEFEGKRVLAVFQPHQRNRTRKLFAEFVAAFCRSPLHNFLIAEIFDVAGRERPEDKDISSRMLVDAIKKCGKKAEFAKDLAELEQKIRDVAAAYDIIILMGAGDIYKIAEKLTNK